MGDIDNDEPIDEENTFKILVATDIHLGYNEKHPIASEDTFVTFEEILKIGVKEEVDFILLGGDLFHDSKPSPYCIQKCSELIRRYCFGDKPVNVEFLSDQSYHFSHLQNPVVNYEDPNINVSIPIFSIHGNHDDPTGNKSVSALDLLSTNGLLNYFGKWTDLSSVEVHPILLQKGTSEIALYGLSHIHDIRLARLYRDKKVTIVKPQTGKYFNLLVVHQNRANRGPNNFLPPSSIPDFMDLVIWGHEHDCKIEPEKQLNGVQISQPGSSVATSLSEGESLPKHVGILYVKNNKYALRPVPLQTVRPFIFKMFTLPDPAILKDKQGVIDLSQHAIDYVSEVIDGIIKQVKEDRASKGLKEMLPLVRVVVYYHVEKQQFNGIRLSQKYIGMICNQDDIVLQKLVLTGGRTRRNRYLGGADDTGMDDDDDGNQVKEVNDLIDLEFDKEDMREQMKILSVRGMHEAVSRFVNHQDQEALEDLINFQIKSSIDQLIEMETNERNIDEKIEELYKKRMDLTEATEMSNISTVLDKQRKRPASASSPSTSSSKIIDVSDDDVEVFETLKPARGRGRGRGSRGGKVGKAAEPKEEKRGRGRGRARGRAKLIDSP